MISCKKRVFLFLFFLIDTSGGNSPLSIKKGKHRIWFDLVPSTVKRNLNNPWLFNASHTL